MKIYIENYGCSANYNNGEIIAGLLKKAGHQLIKEDKTAKIIILNTCTVKQPTENKIIKRIKQIPKSKKLIIAGCMPEVQAEELKKLRKDLHLLGIGNIGKINELVEKIRQGKNKGSHSYIGENKETKLLLPKIRRNPAINIVQISEGCNQNCAYCIVRIAKGSLVSYPADKIIQEIKQSIKEGCKEIWITSQDNAAYENNLVVLLNEFCKVEGDFMVRVGMMNPAHILKMKKDLIDIYKNKKIFKFLHIPIQSGNDRILDLMNRKYSANDFRKIISDFRKEIPEMTVGTDIICGFPTETDDEFNDSLKLIKQLRISVVNVSRFGPRKGTAAAKMKQLPGWQTKKRSQELARLFKKISEDKLKKYIGTKQNILIDEIGRKKGQFIGRTMNYLPVVVEGKPKKLRLGELIEVNVIDSKTHHLVGQAL
ncbi:MAG: tRNA (N(6)-L-threonylcarbamoyladenosine(37)-C(2))-methylthiotransferase [Nanoarchaeota archaeon]|nr:tRNA (N(6)-L-threonylcarbamoyladenosine(37)-C(2))-methylthiotransferase [Nanoarchaeota archaeon]